MKKCSKCGLEKEDTDFYKDSTHKDGLSAHCKSCRIQKQQKYYSKHIPQKKEYDKSYRKINRLKHQKQCHDYYQTNKQKINSYYKEYKSRPENRKKETTRSYSRKHISLKGQKCVICGSKEKLERHHPDYTKPLEIVVMCQDCHQKNKES